MMIQSTIISKFDNHRTVVSSALVLALMLLSGCGGGGGAATPPVQSGATTLPETLTIAATSTTDIQTPIQFKPSNDITMLGISYAWDFGDGQTSQLAQPNHTYLQAGNYRVELKISNAAQQHRTAHLSISLDNKAHLTGLSCSEPNQSGWCRVYPPEVSPGFSDVIFISPTVGWSGNRNGDVFKTTDGGVSWTPLATGVTGANASALMGLRMWDARTLWAVSTNLSIQVSRDGGSSWSNTGQLSSEIPMDDMMAVGPQALLGLRAGLPHAVSRDAGMTWTRLDAKVRSAQCDGTLWRVEDGQVTLSRDLGTSFQAVPALGVTRTAVLTFFPHDAQSLTIVEQNSNVYTYWRTQDGGQSWASSPFFEGRIPSNLHRLGTREYLYRQGEIMYYSTDAGRSYAPAPLDLTFSKEVAELSEGVVIAPFYVGAKITADRGATWQVVNPPQPDQAFYSNLAPRVTGAPAPDNLLPKFTLADDGALMSWNWPGNTGLYRSTDRGQSWTLVAGLTPSQQIPLRSVLPLSRELLLAISTSSDVLQSKDSGRTWTIRLKSNVVGANRLLRLDAKTAWLDDTHRTTDGGETWERISLSNRVYQQSFLNAQLGWANSAATGTLQVTLDGGRSWLPLCVEAICPKSALLAFRDANNGIAISLEGSYRTTDGGKTWNLTAFQPQTVFGVAPYSEVFFTGTNQAWANLHPCIGTGSSVPWSCRSALIKSTDGGQHWSDVNLEIDPYGVNAIQFFDDNRGWVYVPSKLQQNFTEDGGQTWFARYLPLWTGQSPRFIDMRTGWVLTKGGELFATGTGGAAPTVPTASTAKSSAGRR